MPYDHTGIVVDTSDPLSGYDMIGDGSDLSLVADATYSGGIVTLTEDLSSKKGAAWNVRRLDVVNPFQIDFAFDVTASGATADGLAFVLQGSSATAIGESGGGIGYGGLTAPIPNAIAVEFDTFQNNTAPEAYGDPAADHMAVMAGGANHNTSQISGRYDIGTLIGSHTVSVSYDGSTMTVSLDGVQRLTYTGSLSALLGSGDAWIGFTASTGGNKARHRVTAWTLDGRLV